MDDETVYGGKKPEEMTSRIMPEPSRSMKPQDLMSVMTDVMDQCFTAMSPNEMTSIMHEIVPKMMESCFSQMNIEQRNIGRYRKEIHVNVRGSDRLRKPYKIFRKIGGPHTSPILRTPQFAI